MSLTLEKLPSPLVKETVIVNNILEEMYTVNTGLQSQISSLNLKYLMVYNCSLFRKL